MLETAILITAAGRGLRAGGGCPKQYRRLGGEMVLSRTLSAFAGLAGGDAILVVIHPDDQALYREAITPLTEQWPQPSPSSSPTPGGSVPKTQENVSGEQQPSKGPPLLLPPVFGADSRQGSILAGLRALHSHHPRQVLIHDAARPFPHPALVARVMAALRTHAAVLPALPVADTVKQVHQGRVVKTVPRDNLWLAQTPQGFHFSPLLEAHEAAARSGLSHFTDDASIAEWAGMEVRVVEGHPDNIKLTTPADFTRAQHLLHGTATEETAR